MDAKELKKLISAVSVITEETPIIFDQDGLRIETLDPSHVSMLSAKIPKERMAEYINDGYNCFAIDIRDLTKFCKNIKDGVAVITATADDKPDEWYNKYGNTCYRCFEKTLPNEIIDGGVHYISCAKCGNKHQLEQKKHYDNIKMVVAVENGSRTEITIKGEDYQYDRLKHPELKLTGRVLMPKKELASTLTNFMGYGDHATFIISENMLFIQNDTEVKTIYSDADPIIDHISGSANSSFNLSYLKDFVKGVSSKDVELNIGDDCPISIKDAELDIEFILAPRVIK